MTLATYRFLPWLRRGAAAAIERPPPGQPLLARAGFEVEVDVNDRQVARRSFTLLGPGDVTGVDRRQVIRTDPVPGTTDFEPNVFVSLELDEAALPWLFTPAAPDPATLRLRPWLVLVVVEQREGVEVRASRERPLPLLRIAPPAAPRLELPDLEESYWWAHTQAIVPQGGSLQEILDGDPRLSLARLVCPRRLRPSRRYHACLVPAFSVGARAGRGEAVAGTDLLEPAWRSGDDAPTTVELPVYFHWEFATGPEGDFESLARRLQARPLPDGVGERAMFVGDGGLGLPRLAAGVAVVGRPGALRRPLNAPGALPAEVEATLGPALAALIDAADTPAGGAATPIGLPLYGRWPVAQERIADDGPPWIRELNLDPRYRVAAAAGTRAVQLEQEELMRSAWQQVGALREAVDLVRRARFAARVAERLHVRHFASLDAGELLQVTAPAHARIRLAERTLGATVHASRVPDALASPQLRRALRPGARRRTLGLPAPRPDRLLLDLDDGALVLDAARAAPDGAIDAAAIARLGAADDVVELPDSGGLAVTAAVARALREVAAPPPAPPIALGALAATATPAGFTLVPEINVLGPVAAGLADRVPVLAVDPPARDPALGPLAGRRGVVVRPGARPGALDARPEGGGPRAPALPTHVRDALRVPAGALAAVADPLAPRELAPGVRVSFDAAVSTTRPPVGAIPDLVLGGVLLPALRAALPTTGPLEGGGDGGAPPRPPRPPRPPGAAAAARFRAAAVQALSARVVDSPAPPEPPRLEAARLAPDLLAALEPRPALRRRLGVRLVIDDARRPGRAGPPIRHADDPLAPIHGAPVFDEPLVALVERADSDLLLPGLELVPPDTITLVETNPPFVEACLAGANHEIAREFAWRGLVADRRATSFQRFWDRADGVDVPELHAWTGRLGANADADPSGMSVVLIRGALLRRYPGAMVLAKPAAWTFSGHRTEDLAAPDVDAAFRGSAGPDVVFVGLPLTIEELVGATDPSGPAGHYLVIQQPPTEPRFGLDEDTVARPAPPAAWRDLGWGHMGDGDPAAVPFARADALPAGTTIDGLTWGRDGAHQAAITLRDPVRLLVHARHAIRPSEEG